MKEMAIELSWKGDRVHLVLVNGDKTLHSDTCDPCSDVSRNRILAKLRDKFAALDTTEAEAQLLEMARTGPPRSDSPASVTVVDEDPEPWATPVDGAALLDELVALLRQYVVLPPHGAETVALWILHTFCFACFQYTPRLLVNSPDKRCGKSRLLRLIAALVCRPLACENISAAALFRSIEKFRSTLLLDEADTYLAARGANEELRGIVNAGHERGGKVMRCVGEDSEPVAFNVFSPMALGMIGKPPGTVEDRSIPVAMRRKLPHERVDRFPAGVSLRSRYRDFVSRCLRWVADHSAALMAATPTLPREIDDRAADNWYALLAIADLVGGKWPVLGRQLAVAVMAGRDSDSLGTLILTDLRDLFLRVRTDRMSSVAICSELARLETRPWPDFSHGKEITPRQLASLLRPFDVAPRNMKTSTGDAEPRNKATADVAKGYFASDLADAWSRYLPGPGEDPSPESATPLRGFAGKDLRPNPAATEGGTVADADGRKPLSGKGGSGVADSQQGSPTGTDQEGPVAELRQLVEAMVEELHSMGPRAPFAGDLLRQHYEDMLASDGVSRTLADAKDRYRLMVLGDVPPLRGLDANEGGGHDEA